MVDKILQECPTFDKIDYIGHSQGTTQMFSALALDHGGLNAKINYFIGLAPISDLRETHNENVLLSGRVWKKLYTMTNWMNIYHLQMPLNFKKMKSLCYVVNSACDKFNKSFNPHNSYNVNYWQEVSNSRRGVTSMRQLIHFAQIAKNGFRQFDYNDDYENQYRYGGQDEPPQIDIRNISDQVSISLIYGDKDEIVNEKGVKRLRNMLGKRVKSEIQLKNFSHQSYSIGVDMSWTQIVVDELARNSPN